MGAYYFVDGRYIHESQLEHRPSLTPIGQTRNNERLLTCRGGMGRATEVNVDRSDVRGGTWAQDALVESSFEGRLV